MRSPTRLGLDRYALYVQDYGAPVGFRLAVKHPERVRALVDPERQRLRGRAARVLGADQGLLAGSDRRAPRRTWSRPSTRGARAGSTSHGARRPERISPDAWTVDQALLDRPGNKEIQLQLFYSYRTNPPRYPEWQAYFRQHQPPTLIVWGRNDPIFPAEGAQPYTARSDETSSCTCSTPATSPSRRKGRRSPA